MKHFKAGDRVVMTDVARQIFPKSAANYYCGIGTVSQTMRKGSNSVSVGRRRWLTKYWEPLDQNVVDVATKIADRLFTNGAGQKAERLVLELSVGRTGGGWCEQSVIDQIVQILSVRS